MWGRSPAVLSVTPRLANLKCFLVKDALGPTHFTARAFLVPAHHQNRSSTCTGWGTDYGTFLGICFLKRKQAGTAGTLCPCASWIRRNEVLHKSRSNSAPVHTEKYTNLDSEYLINSTLMYFFSIILHQHLNLQHAVKHTHTKSSTFTGQGLSEQIFFLLSGTIKQWQPYGTFPEKYSPSGVLQAYLGAINTQFIYVIACEGFFEPLLSFVGNELAGICNNSVHFHGTTMPLS